MRRVANEWDGGGVVRRWVPITAITGITGITATTAAPPALCLQPVPTALFPLQ